MEQYGLQLDQMVWRRAKILELKDPMLFSQEYPPTAAEAFEFSGPRRVHSTRGSDAGSQKPCCEGIGRSSSAQIRPASEDDRSASPGAAVGSSQGREPAENRHGGGANLLKQIIDVDNPARVFLDLVVLERTFDILQAGSAL